MFQYYCWHSKLKNKWILQSAVFQAISSVWGNRYPTSVSHENILGGGEGEGGTDMCNFYFEARKQHGMQGHSEETAKISFGFLP